jgi:archaellum biogenesis ATPase FlaH
MFKSVCVINMNRKAFPTAILAAVQDIVDCVIEMKIEEKTNGLHNYMRVSKAKGFKHITTWTPYQVRSDYGLVEENLLGRKGGL